MDGEGHVRVDGAIEIEVTEEDFADGIGAALQRSGLLHTLNIRDRRFTDVGGSKYIRRLWRYRIPAVSARELKKLIRTERKRNRLRG